MRTFLIGFFLISLNLSFSQEHAWVYFTDKPDETTAMANPLSMLTQRALDRRIRQNIALDFKDVPISSTYINQIIAQSGIVVSAKSKWLNGLHVFGSETSITALETLPFVDYVEFADSSLNARPVNNGTVNELTVKFDVLTNYNYGGSFNQSNQIRVDYLHEQNFTGSTMQIAVIDAGFPGVDTFSVFQQLRNNNQILGGYDFVARSTNFYQGHRHGTSVLSTIGGFVDNELIGTAPDASFYLFRTEDAIPETPLEESLWVEAAEKSDSLGVDIINTSLGYKFFDESKYNHFYNQMDGNTTFISRGANIAAERGIIVVVAAGNDGVLPFYKIGSPADATNVFTIGAVDSNGAIANFSSFGPSFDNRIKPDVCAKGSQATVVDVNGNVATGNGTSYASPIMTGAIACLWQAYPNKTNYEIMQMIRESAHLFANPTDQEGYGIPNFENAFLVADLNSFNLENLKVYPNPVKDMLYFEFLNKDKSYKVSLYNILGKEVIKNKNIINKRLDFSKINSGIYFVKISDGTKFKVLKIVKE